MPTEPAVVRPESRRRRGRGPRYDLYPLLPEETRLLLDVGCAEGLGFVELRQRGVTVVGIELRPLHAAQAAAVLDRAYCLDAQSFVLPDDDVRSFDTVVFADSLEHLAEPSLALMAAQRYLKPGGKLVISVPNFRYWRVIAKLLLGRWDYATTGILSRHHLRFFTRFSLTRLLEGCGFDQVRFHQTSDHVHGADRLLHVVTLGALWELFSQSLTVTATVGSAAVTTDTARASGSQERSMAAAGSSSEHAVALRQHVDARP